MCNALRKPNLERNIGGMKGVDLVSVDIFAWLCMVVYRLKLRWGAYIHTLRWPPPVLCFSEYLMSKFLATCFYTNANGRELSRCFWTFQKVEKRISKGATYSTLGKSPPPHRGSIRSAALARLYISNQLISNSVRKREIVKPRDEDVVLLTSQSGPPDHQNQLRLLHRRASSLPQGNCGANSTA